MKRIVLLFVVLVLSVVLRADVSLTIPVDRPGVFGGAGTIGYDRIRTTRIVVDPQTNTVQMSVEIFVSTDGSRRVHTGLYTINTATATFTVDSMGFDQSVGLTPAQASALISTLDSHRNTMEQSMVALGLVDGTQIVAQLNIDKPGLDFGEVALGQTKTLPLTITNVGTVPVTIEDVSVSESGQLVVRVRGN